MGLATIIDSLACHTIPSYSIVRYQDSTGVGAGANSTELIEIELPSLYTSSASYLEEPRTHLTSKAYAIDLSGISIACLSASYSFKILNRNDISLINTIYEVMSYSNINLSMSDSYPRYIIRNRDLVLTNKLYMYIANAGIATGPINFELSYISIQDRTF